ncbi:MAG: PAS domain S-box protein [Spirochaetes bacterium]|jgi:PAS domain S-box-containing protein|nr:PAS domain S-box protein [Spirochaetota bacterium]
MDHNGKKILLVEDEALIAMQEKEQLEGCGYSVHHVFNGEDAVRVALDPDSNFDLVLMDIDLGSGLDGTHAAEQILQQREIPLVFVSSHAEPEIVKKTEKITSYGYVVKNTGITVLDISIKMALRLFDAKKQIVQSEEKHRQLFETMSPGVVYHSADGIIISANPAAEKILGLTVDQMNGKTTMDPRWKMITENGETVSGLEHPAIIALRTGEKVGPVDRAVFIPEENRYVWLSITAIPLFKPADSKPCQVYSTFDDITKRKQAELKMSEYEWIVEKTDLPRISSPAQPYGDVTEYNTSRVILDGVGKANLAEMADDVMSLLGTSIAVYEANGDYAYGKFASGWCRFMDSASFKLCAADNTREALDCGKWLCHENCWNDSAVLAIKSGQPSDISCVGGINLYAVPVFVHNNVLGVVSIGYGNPPKDDDTLKSLSEKYSVDFEELKKRANSYKVRPDFIIELGKKRCAFMARLIGEIIERKWAEKDLQASELKFRSLVEQAAEMLYLHDLQGNFIDVNREAIINTGFSREELLRMNVFDIDPDSQIRDDLKKYWQKIEVGDPPVTFEVRQKRRDGSIYPVEFTLSKVNFSDNYYMLALARDITERKKTEDEIRRQLSEKETLLKEVHHRIKNSIAQVEGLLAMQAGSTDDIAVKTALQEAISRVKSIRVLYEKLLIGKGYRDVSIKNYIESLIDSLAAVFSDTKKVKIEKRIKDFELNTKLAVPVGIIINELLTNVFKYAFSESEDNRVLVEIDRVENMVTLVIQDNGAGLDETKRLNESPGFGLTIVKMLAEQLKATYSIENHGGTKCVLEFEV